MFRPVPIPRIPRVLALLLLICLLVGGLGPRFAAQGASAALSVRAVSPAASTTEVGAATTILVAFDRPVVALGAAGAPPPPSPLASSPRLGGTGRWVTTSIYSWQARALHAATVYRLTVRAGLRAIDGTRLASDFSWSFATIRPAVRTVSPDDGYQYAVPRPELTVTFNQRMDRAATEAAFALHDSREQPVHGAFTWRDSDTTLVFRPAAPLQRTETYMAAIGAGARSAEGPLLPHGAITWRFGVASLLQVIGSTPRDGDRSADLSNGVNVAFTAPIESNSAITHVSITPELPARYISLGEDGLSIQISGAFAPSTAYTVQVRAGLKAVAGDALRAPYRFSFVTAPLPPSLAFVTGNVASYDAYRPIRLSLQAINPGPISYSVYRLDRASFASVVTQGVGANSPLPAVARLIISRSETPATVLNRVTPLEEPLALPNGQPLAPGYYLVRAAGLGQAVDQQVLLVTRTNLTLKVAQRQALIWATDLRSGQPIPGMAINVLAGNGGPIVEPPVTGPIKPGAGTQSKASLHGRTGADGTLLLTVPGLSPDRSLAGQGLLAFGDRAGDVAAASSGWGNGIEPYSYGIDGSYGQQLRRIVLYTDRPIYRPGQQVHLRGLVRADDDGRYSLVNDPVSLTFTDDQGRTVARRTLTPDRFGAFSATFSLGADAALGYYSANVTSGSAGASTGIQVAAYRKPTFAVTVSPALTTYVRGQSIDSDIAVTYYFGGGVPNAHVHWSLLGYDYIFFADRFPDYIFGAYDPASFAPSGGAAVGIDAPIVPYGGGYTLYQGEAVTDGQGRLYLHLPARLPKDRTVQSYTLEANVTDLDRQPVAGSSSVVVYRSAVQIGLQPVRQTLPINAADPIRIVTLGDDGTTPIPNQPVAITIYRRTFTNTVTRNPDGTLNQITVPHDTLLRRAAVTTDARGRTVYPFSAAVGGEYHLVAASKDRYGNPTTSTLELYVGGEQPVDWGFQPQGHIRVVTDRPLYHSGDVAHLLIATPKPGLQALISIERGDILAYSTRALTGTSTTIDVPVPASYLPDTYVSVVVVGGAGASGPPPTWRLGYAQIKVDAKERALNVTVSPAAPRVMPGAPLRLHITAKDYRGHPAQAELSLSVVDEAALALAGDSGEGADLLGQFYGSRALGVLTADTLNMSPEQLLTRRPLAADQPGFGADHVAAGGGPGGLQAQSMRSVSAPLAGARNASTPQIRTQFADTAYWNGAVQTDAAGQATLTVPLPDNLTTWRILGQGLTTDTLVGAGVGSVIATKDLTLRPLLPRFLTLGDRALVGATINNTTDTARTVRLRLLLGANGAAPAAQSGAKTIRLAAGAEATLTWPVQAAVLGTLTLGVQAVDIARPSMGDAVAVTLPVTENSTPEDVATAGTAGASTQEAVRIPAGIEPDEGSLTVTLEPTLAAGLGMAGDFLRAYPYDSSIDLAARVLGQAELGRLPARAAVLTAAQRAALRPEIARLLARLYPMQHGDGGFGWWIDDPYSSLAITVQVVQALAFVGGLGYPVRPDALADATAYLLSNARSPSVVNAGANYDADLQAGIIYALTLAGRGRDVATLAAELFDVRALLGYEASAQLAVALATQDATGNKGRVATLLADLVSAAKLNPTGIHWDEDSYDWGDLGSSTTSTASVLDALVRIDPHSPLIPNTVRWLMAARKVDAWESTEATALSLQGLVDYILVSGELNGHYRYRVTRNGAIWGIGSVNASNLTRRSVLSGQIGTQVAPGSTQRIAIGRDVAPHDGTLYYTVRLRYYRPVDRIGALSEGVSVSRRYQFPSGVASGIHPFGSLDNTGVTGKGLSGAPVDSTVQVVLTVTAPQDLFYVTLEDPLPAGGESVDTSLRTTSQLATLNSTVRIPRGTGDLGWYVTHTELRDDHTALFLSYLPAGTYQYTYLVHLSTVGAFHALPAHIAQTYFPEVFGRSNGSYFSVR